MGAFGCLVRKTEKSTVKWVDEGGRCERDKGGERQKGQCVILCLQQSDERHAEKRIRQQKSVSAENKKPGWGTTTRPLLRPIPGRIR